jgi:hypothetical protein
MEVNMITCRRTGNAFAQALELEWVLIDESHRTVVAYFYDELTARAAAEHLELSGVCDQLHLMKNSGCSLELQEARAR